MAFLGRVLLKIIYVRFSPKPVNLWAGGRLCWDEVMSYNSLNHRRKSTVFEWQNVSRWCK